MIIGTSGDGVGGGRGSSIAGGSSRRTSSSSSFFWDKLYKIQPYIGPIVALIIFLYGLLPPTNNYELSLGVSSDGSLGNSYDGTSNNKQQLRVAVFTEQGHDAIARKQEQVLEEDDYADDDDYNYSNHNLLLRYYRISTNQQILDVEQQRYFLNKNKLACGERSVQRFDELVQKNQQHLATELWKYCSMWVSLKDDNEGKGGRDGAGSTRSGTGSKYDAALFVDRSSPLLVEWTEIVSQAMIANAEADASSSSSSSSIAVLGDPKYFPETIHSSFLYLTKSHASIAYSMLKLISNTPITALVETATSSLLVQRGLYQLITTTKNENNKNNIDSSKWYLLEQKCHNMDPLVRVPGRPSSDNHKVFTCPTKSEFCCSVRTPSPSPLPLPQQQEEEEEVGSEKGGSTAIKAATTAADPIVVLLNRHPTLPFQKITETMVRPYRSSNTDSYGEDELPYISTVRAAVYERPDSGSSGGDTTNTTVIETPNLYEVFLEKNMLPKVKCRRCLNMRRCTSHESYCQEYMKNVCEEAKDLQPKFVSRRLVITPPLYRRDPSRLVPRILHQTWYETLSQDDCK